MMLRIHGNMVAVISTAHSNTCKKEIKDKAWEKDQKKKKKDGLDLARLCNFFLRSDLEQNILNV